MMLMRLGGLAIVGGAAVLLLAPLVAAAQDQAQTGDPRARGQARADQRQARADSFGARGGRGGARNFPAEQDGAFTQGGFGAQQAAPGAAVGGSGPGLLAALADRTARASSQRETVAAAAAKRLESDPLDGFGSRVSAVLDISTMPHLLVTENEFGVTNTRDLAIGDEYRDGWALGAVNGGNVTMKKGDQTREVALNMNLGPARAAPTALPANLAGGGQGPGGAGRGPGGALSFSNGAAAPGGAQPGPGRGGFSGQQIDPAQMAALASRITASIDPNQIAALATQFGGGNIDPAQIAAMTDQLRAVLGNGAGGGNPAASAAAAAAASAFLNGALQGVGGREGGIALPVPIPGRGQ